MIAILLVSGSWQLLDGGYIYLKALLGQYLIADAWQKTLHDGQMHRPWPWADTWPVARLQLPGKNVDLLVLAGDHGQSLAFGPGLSGQGVQPGRSGVSLISGHRDTHFRFMRQLSRDDELLLQTADGATYRYRIREGRVVDNSTFSLTAGSDEHFLLLVTCFPFDTLEEPGQRLVVIAEQLDEKVLMAGS